MELFNRKQLPHVEYCEIKPKVNLLAIKSKQWAETAQKGNAECIYTFQPINEYSFNPNKYNWTGMKTKGFNNE